MEPWLSGKSFCIPGWPLPPWYSNVCVTTHTMYHSLKLTTWLRLALDLMSFCFCVSMPQLQACTSNLSYITSISDYFIFISIAKVTASSYTCFSSLVPLMLTPYKSIDFKAKKLPLIRQYIYISLNQISLTPFFVSRFQIPLH